MDERDRMDFKKLRKVLRTYGANVRHWPRQISNNADTQAFDKQEIREVVRQEQELDRLLDHAGLYQPSAELAAEILMLGERRKLPRWLAAFWPFPAAWRPATIMTGALLIGLLFGAIYVPETSADYLDTEIEELLLG